MIHHCAAFNRKLQAAALGAALRTIFCTSELHSTENCKVSSYPQRVPLPNLCPSAAFNRKLQVSLLSGAPCRGCSSCIQQKIARTPHRRTLCRPGRCGCCIQQKIASMAASQQTSPECPSSPLHSTENCKIKYAVNYGLTIVGNKLHSTENCKSNMNPCFGKSRSFACCIQQKIARFGINRNL